MTQYRKIHEKAIWVVMKVYPGGQIEVGDAFWDEKSARLSASELIGKDNAMFSIHNITLHGLMVDKI